MKRLRSAAVLTIAGMLTALVALATMVLKLPVPITQGYVHLGDTFILLSAMLVGPIAAPIGGIGSALADLIGGYSLYVLPTLVIKALVGFLASRYLRSHGKYALLRCALVFGMAELVMVAGYFAFECFAYNVPSALGAVPMNLAQAVFSVVFACLLLPMARRVAPMVGGSGSPM